MNRFVSEPLEIPQREPGEEFSRADLVFYGIDHSGPSYEGLVFIDNPDAGVDTARDPSVGYVGSFSVFAHGGCYGDVGHCDVKPRDDPFDVRPPHPLTPWTRTLILPEEAVRALEAKTITVTVVPVVAGAKGPEATDALTIDRVRLVAYAD